MEFSRSAFASNLHPKEILVFEKWLKDLPKPLDAILSTELQKGNEIVMVHRTKELTEIVLLRSFSQHHQISAVTKTVVNSPHDRGTRYQYDRFVLTAPAM